MCRANVYEILLTDYNPLCSSQLINFGRITFSCGFTASSQLKIDINIGGSGYKRIHFPISITLIINSEVIQVLIVYYSEVIRINSVN